MKSHKKKISLGLTLVEVMVAATVVVIAIIGAIGFRYYCALDARKADVQITAARVGLMMLEQWKGMGGRSSVDPYNNYDPVNMPVMTSQIILSSDVGPDVPVDFNAFGSYRIIVDDAYYYATLSYQDEIANDLRILSVSVAWPQDYPTGTFSAGDRSVRFTTKINLPG